MARTSIDPSFHPHAGGHQEDRVDVRAIALFGTGLVIVILVVLIVLWLFMARFSAIDRERQEARPLLFEDTSGQYPEPRLQPSPRLQMDELRRRDQQRLETYGWVDREDGIVRIPIERAIDLVSEPGALPVRPNSDPDSSGGPE